MRRGSGKAGMEEVRLTCYAAGVFVVEDCG